MQDSKPASSRLNTFSYGYRLLPQLIDERAEANHARPHASIPKSTDIEQGFDHVSYWAFANAINRCAHWLINTVGRSSSSEVLVYLATPDLRYQILAIAAVKAGYVVRDSK
jgi:acyl-CoA synthetase (AMP-forming)/AMP-acid ligase II